MCKPRSHCDKNRRLRSVAFLKNWWIRNSPYLTLPRQIFTNMVSNSHIVLFIAALCCPLKILVYSGNWTRAVYQIQVLHINVWLNINHIYFSSKTDTYFICIFEYLDLTKFCKVILNICKVKMGSWKVMKLEKWKIAIGSNQTYRYQQSYQIMLILRVGNKSHIINVREYWATMEE